MLFSEADREPFPLLKHPLNEVLAESLLILHLNFLKPFCFLLSSSQKMGFQKASLSLEDCVTVKDISGSSKTIIFKYEILRQKAFEKRNPNPRN